MGAFPREHIRTGRYELIIRVIPIGDILPLKFLYGERTLAMLLILSETGRLQNESLILAYRVVTVEIDKAAGSACGAAQCPKVILR